MNILIMDNIFPQILNFLAGFTEPSALDLKKANELYRFDREPRPLTDIEKMEEILVTHAPNRVTCLNRTEYLFPGLH